MACLSIEKLTYHHGIEVNLTIDGPECACISGPSGSGKTLLLRAIADLDPHDGRVTLDGLDRADIDAPTWRRRVGLLPAHSAWWGTTVGEHFLAGPPNNLEALGFDDDVLGWEIRRLSTGERQRLAIFRLLANEPEAILLDEPTANLDPANLERVEGFIRDYQLRTQAPALWVTHDQAQVARLQARFYQIDGTRVVEQPGGAPVP